MHRRVGLVLVCCVLLVGGSAGVSSAQVVSGAQDADDPGPSVDSEGGDPASDEEEPFDGRSTDDTVRLVVGALIGIAAATALMMFMFIWHTSPRRRLRVATRRAARRRANARTGLATESDPGSLAADEPETDDARG